MIPAERQALVRRTWRVVGAVAALVVAVMLIFASLAMRSVGHEWSKQDVVECQSSAFVGEAARAGEAAAGAALKECLEQRRRRLGDAPDNCRTWSVELGHVRRWG